MFAEKIQQIARNETKDGAENPTPSFCTADSLEKGFFYSCNIQVKGYAAFGASRLLNEELGQFAVRQDAL